jgi:large subunit ribosomal protein L6
MSRIGRAPVTIPAGVEVKVADGNVVTVKGPKGALTQTLDHRMTIEVEDNAVRVLRPDDEQFSRSLHGLTRSLIQNMVQGVTEEYSKTLEINGVGYRAAKEGKNLVMNLGYSHQVIVPDTDDVRTEVPNPNQVVVKGMDKQKVGQFAADVRAKRPPEPYKGKGIKYADEHIVRKEGKTGAK